MNTANRLFLIYILFHSFNLACSAKSSNSCLVNSIANLRIAIPENTNSNNSIAAPRSCNNSTSFTRLRPTSIPIEIPEPNSVSSNSYMRPISNNTLALPAFMTKDSNYPNNNDMDSSASNSSSDNEMTQFRMSDDEKRPIIHNKKRKKNSSAQMNNNNCYTNVVDKNNAHLDMPFEMSDIEN